MGNSPVRFAVGGPVQAKNGTYISRPADKVLFEASKAGEFSYVLACRQIGKSSLMNETVSRLSQIGIKTACLDLNRIGRNVKDADSWYFSLIHVLARNLHLELDVQTWWDERSPLATLSQRFLQFFDEVVLTQVAGPITIFIDEIDMTLGLDFTDDFFGTIRVIHNERAQNSAYSRLTFVLLGVATPDELIDDNTRTPFNIGRAITLYDFTLDQCAPFRQVTEAKYPNRGGAYFNQIYSWTGGHPYLTQKLCQAILDAEQEDSPTFVDSVVRELFIAEKAQSDDNIQFVQNRVLGDQHAQDMLKIYRSILKSKEGVADEEQSPAINRLKLYGLILAENDLLRVRNKLYAEVFDLDWVDKHLISDRRIKVAIGIIVLLILLLVGLFIWNQQIVQENQRKAVEIQQLQDQIQDPADVTMKTQFYSLNRLIEIDKENPTQAPLAREAFNKLSYAQKLFMFENATNNHVQPNEYKEVVEKTYTWLDNSEDNNNLLAKIKHFSVAQYGFDEEIEQLADQIDDLLKGREHLADERWQDAEEAYTKIINQTGITNPYIYLERGQVQIEQGDWLDALTDFEIVMGLNIPDTAIREMLQNPNLRQALQENKNNFPALSALLETLISDDLALIPTPTPVLDSTPTSILLDSPTNILDETPDTTITATSNPSPATESTDLSPVETTPTTSIAKPTLTPTPTPKPLLYEAPILVSPENGVGRLVKIPLLKWRLEGHKLQPGEVFSLRIWSDNPEEPEIGPVLLRTDSLDSNLIHSHRGKIYWSVTVVQLDSEGAVIRAISPESEIRWFAYDHLGRVGEEIAKLPTLVMPPDLSTPSPPPSLPISPTSRQTPDTFDTSTPSPITGITTGDIYIREGPSIDYSIVDGLQAGNEISILGVNPSQNWFKITGPNVVAGWIATNYIDTTVALEDLPVLLGPLKPSASPVTISSSDFPKEIDSEAPSSIGQLNPGSEEWYTFTTDQPTSTIVLMFQPNANSLADRFIGYKVRFALYTAQVIDWPPKNADHLNHIGLGLWPPEDRDGRLDTGELIWNGPLTRNARFYLRVVNESDMTINYCLATRDVFEWICHSPADTPTPTVLTREKDNAIMVYVPAGEFTMGRDDTWSDQEPAHPVHLDAFWIDKYEITRAQYQTCINSGVCSKSCVETENCGVKEADSFNRDEYKLDTQPIVGIYWTDAFTYCNWVDARLPTEAEWEKAARGEDGRLYPWGDEFISSNLNSIYADGFDNIVAPVGSFPEGASPYGVLDMAGNAWEWTGSLYRLNKDKEEFFKYPYDSEDGRENLELGDNPNSTWSVRGGSWENGDENVTTTWRNNYTRGTRYAHTGFRCARSAE